MEISDEKKEQLKYFIIENFNNQPENIKREFQREFQRQVTSITPEMKKTVGILLSNFYNELNLKDVQMFVSIENPVNLIEEVLFEYINS
ncbi:MAG TPA: hypothetical protein PK762_09890 [Candidatus Kapabacteria bacterium]|nr:hypothetical protein [Candidatus Kapabacteria bacterium]